MKTDVLGIEFGICQLDRTKVLVLGLPGMVTSSVRNTRTNTGVLGINIVVLGLPKMVTSSV